MSSLLHRVAYSLRGRCLYNFIIPLLNVPLIFIRFPQVADLVFYEISFAGIVSVICIL